MRIKRLLFSGLAFVAAATSAFSEDVKPVRRIPPAAVTDLPPHAATWDGIFLGPTLGWATGRAQGAYHGTPPAPPTTSLTPAGEAGNCSKTAANADLSEAAFYVVCALLDPITPGAVAGYDFQFGRVIAGIEGDVGWIGRHSPIIWAPDGTARYDQFGVTWTGHLRGRVGYAFGQYLPYVAGGLALAGFNAAHFRSDATGSALYTARDTRVGYSIGGGVEVADLLPRILPGWVLRGEYLYDYFSPQQYDWVPGMRYSVLDLTMHTVRAAAVYRFPIPR